MYIYIDMFFICNIEGIIEGSSEIHTGKNLECIQLFSTRCACVCVSSLAVYCTGVIASNEVFMCNIR